VPELPEIELLRRDLDRDVGGRKVKAVDVPGAGLVSHPTKKAFATALVGTKLTGARRRGTTILVGVDGTHEIVLTLGDQTRLRRQAAKEPTIKGTAMVISFTQGPQLRLIDPKRQGSVELVAVEELAERHPEFANLGLDPADEPISWTTFGEALLRRDERLKVVLTDPTFLVGIGPVYSDEILFHAGLRYDRIASGLNTQEIRRLYRAVVETVHDAIKYGGTSIGPDGWVGLDGSPGSYGEHLTVYKRDGQMSPRSRGPIVKTRYGSGYTYYCEQTQV
jgi:formamidopyrimidine-DNA glycosylase